MTFFAGVFQIGVLISYVLFGVTTTQAYIYYSRFPDDSPKIKGLVAFVWLCEIAHVICIGHVLYTYTISDYTHPERLALAAPKSLSTSILFSGIIAASVQGFFSFRIYTLSKKLYITLIIWTMSFLRLLGTVVAFVVALRMIILARFEAQWGWLLTVTWSVSTANDLAITVTLVVLLRSQRTSMYKRTTALVDKLITWTIETGLLTSAAGIVMLVCFVTMKQNSRDASALKISTIRNSNLVKSFQTPSWLDGDVLSSLNSRATLRAMNEIPLPSLTSPIGARSDTGMQITKVTQIKYDAEPYSVPCDDAKSEV
ncbi:hypothetical protein B0H13DRAFT_1871419 [Mycena leptocephala]|nr:hypothetical protein B0H13DRAFT_1871419 [Mycena leptocephala]